jgi:glycosyltransferase involved in cell wall biosynthesis
MKISVTVITRNEAALLPAMLASVRWADEVIVVDCGSTDGTVRIATESGCRVVNHAFVDFASQKNFAHTLATNDWIFNLDADEHCPEALAKEIQALPESGPNGYFVARRNYFQNRWIRHCGWFPDYKLRIYRRSAGAWKGRVHETVELTGQTARLETPLNHYTYKGFERYLDSVLQYSRLAAEQLHEEGKSAGPLDLLLRPPAGFIREYILRAGFLDGRPGFVISALTAYGIFCRYSFLWEMRGGGRN